MRTVYDKEPIIFPSSPKGTTRLMMINITKVPYYMFIFGTNLRQPSMTFVGAFQKKKKNIPDHRI